MNKRFVCEKLVHDERKRRCTEQPVGTKKRRGQKNVFGGAYKLAQCAKLIVTW